MQTPTQSYRCSFSTLFLWTVVALLFLDSLKMLILQGVPLYDLDVLHNFQLIVIISLVSSTILVLTLKSEISPEGISSYNSWGGSFFIPWHEITNAQTWNFFGLGYFRIEAGDGTRIYVARYLSRQREFEMIVTAITDQRNPLRLCIEGREDEI